MDVRDQNKCVSEINSVGGCGAGKGPAVKNDDFHITAVDI